MSTKQPGQDKTTAHPDTLVHQAAPLSPLEAFAAEEEAIRRALETSEAVVEGQRRGKVEAETHRISEEVTRQAQARLRAQMRAAAAPVPPPAERAEASHMVPWAVPIQHLLVPLSGTPFAERALPFAEVVAGLTGASITLAHVDHTPGPIPGPHVTELLGHLMDVVTGTPTHTAPADSAAYLTELCTRMAVEASAMEIQVARATSVVNGLLELEARADADLVVLAAQPRLGAEQHVLGTVAPALLRTGWAPLLVIPPEATVASDHLPTLARALVPLDGSPLAEQALGPLVALLAGSGRRERGVREIVLFSVSETPGGLHDARIYLRGVQQLLATSIPANVAIRVAVWPGSAPGAIVAMAREGAQAPHEDARRKPAFDLVVMATHGRGGVGRWVFGSAAEYVLARAEVPVLVTYPVTTDEL